MKNIILLTIVFVSVIEVSAQSGGVYSITQSVIANGGGDSSGGTYAVSGTIGQTLTDTSEQTPYKVDSGFWQAAFVPTASGATISGRVLTADGRGLRNAVVTLTDERGNTRQTRTASFGYYAFEDVESGQIVVLNVTSKLYQFNPRAVTLTEDLADLDFVPVAAIGTGTK